jgi:hypothetical protein
MACHRIRFALRGNSGEPSRRYAALVWLSVAVGGLPNRPWSGGDVAGVLQVSPDWLNEAVGMTTPLSALPRLLLVTRDDRNTTEQPVVVLAGVADSAGDGG